MAVDDLIVILSTPYYRILSLTLTAGRDFVLERRECGERGRELFNFLRTETGWIRTRGLWPEYAEALCKFRGFAKRLIRTARFAHRIKRKE